jgi:phosphate transport system permease protein
MTDPGNNPPTTTESRSVVDKDEPPLSPPAIGDEHVVPRGVGGDSTGDDPTAPAVERPEHVVIGSAEPLAVGTFSGPPVVGAGSAAAGGRNRIGDRVFAGLASGSSIFVILLVVLVAVFLIIKSVRSIADDKVNFLTSTEWAPTQGNLRFGVAPLLYTTVMISIVALVLAVPVAIGIALFITQYAPKRLAKPVAYVVDLLAAIPSIIYGIWGYSVLAPRLEPVQRALYHLGGFPLFKDKGIGKGSLFDGGVVLAVMILPIITAISRDVFERTPRANKEAALALGSTKWEMIRMTVLPYGRAGVVSGSMLGLGRALGETIAVLLILSKVSHFSPSLFSGGETIASKIAGNAAEFNNPASTGAFIAAGLVLFLLTFVVNASARWIVNRRKDFV